MRSRLQSNFPTPSRMLRINLIWQAVGCMPSPVKCGDKVASLRLPLLHSSGPLSSLRHPKLEFPHSNLRQHDLQPILRKTSRRNRGATASMNCNCHTEHDLSGNRGETQCSLQELCRFMQHARTIDAAHPKTRLVSSKSLLNYRVPGTCMRMHRVCL